MNREPNNSYEPILAAAPGPSPWYLEPNKPFLDGMSWEKAGDGKYRAGKIILKSNHGDILLALDFHNYVSLYKDKYLFIWWQDHEAKGPSKPVNVKLLDPHGMIPLEGDIDVICKTLAEARLGVIYKGDSEMDFLLSTEVAGADIQFAFPEIIREINEVLVLCHSTGIRDRDDDRENLGILIAWPSLNKYRIYPQEWFNLGKFDFMYQWVTRVARVPDTGEVIGEGIRIGSFILQPNLMWIKEFMS